MEIHSLRLVVTEQDLNQLAAREMRNQPVQEVQIRVTPEGVSISGVYPLMMKVPFETIWHLSVQAGKVAAHLANLRVSGFGAGMFRGILLSMLGEAVSSEDWLRFEEETLLIDPDVLLARHGLFARTNLTAVRCEQAWLVIEAAKSTF